MKIGRLAISLLTVALLAGCAAKKSAHSLRIFHAAGLSATIEGLRDGASKDLGITLLAEGSGSQTACRKLAELKRECDIIMLADADLVARLLGGVCSWRLDFARDEIVLGVGLRAPEADRAASDWAGVLLDPSVRFARTDESQAPLGYRTLLVWKLKERLGTPGLCERLAAKCDKVVDDSDKLSVLLKTGETDYAFMYRSTCIASDIRFVELPGAINLGSDRVDYASASVTYEKLSSGRRESVTVVGAPIAWTLSVPDSGADAQLAREFIRYLLVEKAELLERNGLRPIRPALFYGPEEAYKPFEDISRRAGGLR